MALSQDQPQVIPSSYVSTNPDSNHTSLASTSQPLNTSTLPVTAPAHGLSNPPLRSDSNLPHHFTIPTQRLDALTPSSPMFDLDLNTTLDSEDHTRTIPRRATASPSSANESSNRSRSRSRSPKGGQASPPHLAGIHLRKFPSELPG